jgi:hypothetical protein
VYRPLGSRRRYGVSHFSFFAPTRALTFRFLGCDFPAGLWHGPVFMMCTNSKIDGKIQLVRWTLIALSEGAVWAQKIFGGLIRFFLLSVFLSRILLSSTPSLGLHLWLSRLGQCSISVLWPSLSCSLPGTIFTCFYVHGGTGVFSRCFQL